MWWSLFILNKWLSVRHKRTESNLIQNKYDDEKIYFDNLKTKIYSLVSY